MDRYGCFRNTAEDISEIRSELDKNGTIVFPFSGDQIGCIILVISKSFHSLAVMPFGGNPKGRVYLSAYGRGASHFAPSPIHYSYFEEKLHLHEEEAKWVESLWKGLFGEDK